MLYDSGSHGIIINIQNDLVRKKSRRITGHNIEVQKRIHALVYNILTHGNYDILRAPRLDESMFYIMERVDTTRPIILGDRDSCRSFPQDVIAHLKRDLASLWDELWTGGYAAWDFDLFLQPDGKVVILDFDRFGVRTGGLLIPVKMPLNIPINSFFRNKCFPRNFDSILRL